VKEPKTNMKSTHDHEQKMNKRIVQRQENKWSCKGEL